MKRLAFWGVTALLCALAAYAGYRVMLHQIPLRAMDKAEAAIAKRAGGWNTMFHPPLPTDRTRTVVRPSPDQFYSACAYDVSEGPLVVEGRKPQGTYWSLSFFQHNTDVFFIVNDRQLASPTYRYVVIGDGEPVPEGVQDEQVIRSPSDTGIVIQRLFVDEGEALDTLDRQRKTATCQALAS